MSKKILAALLAVTLVLSLCSCSRIKSVVSHLIPDEPMITDELPDEEKTSERYVLIVGNSHSIDAFWLLYQAWMDQHPETDLCVGILHYNGACIDEHVEFASTDAEEMRYYKNDSGKWEIEYGVTYSYALGDQPWDTILMQPAKEDLADETLNKDGRHALAALIDQYVTVPHQIMWHISWPSPNDETFFSPDYIRQPPKGYKDKLTRLYGFSPVNQFSLMLSQTKENVLTDPLYDDALCSGAAIMHALLVQEYAQLDLWRDYTHLSDYGRLMVAYALVAQFTDTPVKSIGIDRISVGWRHKQNADQGELVITDEMKQGIVRAAAYAMTNTWEMPQQ